MKKYEMLGEPQRKYLLNRWKSIEEKARMNMKFGRQGSYSTVTGATHPSLEKDRRALATIDAILQEILT